MRNPRMTSTALITAVAFVSMLLSGCFNTYQLTPEEFAKLQSAEEIPVTVTSQGGEQILVEKDTPIYVRSDGGRRYPVTAFNFKMTGSQLVASDRDTLLATAELDKYEVDVFSETQTILLITAGVLAVTGLIVVTAITAGSKSFEDN
ncbi:MAG: hypothetical protein ACI9MR_001954 [Myxococcota bacterium]|jgi:hypothetical protein